MNNLEVVIIPPSASFTPGGAECLSWNPPEGAECLSWSPPEGIQWHTEAHAAGVPSLCPIPVHLGQPIHVHSASRVGSGALSCCTLITQLLV